MSLSSVGRVMTVELITLLCFTCIFLSLPAYAPEATEDSLCYRGPALLSRIEQVPLPAANITIMLRDRIAGTTVNATIGFNFTNHFYGVAFGFVQYFLSVIDGNDTVPVSGLDYTRRGEYRFAYAGSVEIMNSSTLGGSSHPSDNGYPQPAWDIGSSEAAYEGPIRSENISQLTEMGLILHYENLTLCFANGVSKFLGLATIGVNFTRTDDSWSASFIIDMPGIWVSVVKGSVVTIDMDGWVPIDPDWTPPPMNQNVTHQMIFFSYSGLIAIMAFVVVVGVLTLRRRNHTMLFEGQG